MLAKPSDSNIAVVVPCYNEAHRFDRAAFVRFSRENPHCHFIFVNDGSQDGTSVVLESLREQVGDRQVTVLELAKNVGKAESTRYGMRYAHSVDYSVSRGIGYIGYLDADLATPFNELLAMHQVAKNNIAIQAIVGSRLQLSGRRIRRKTLRRFVGSVFTVLTHCLFRLGLRDTQCGAKLFRNQAWLGQVTAHPFHDRWLFDVELLARIRRVFGQEFRSVVYEYPLDQWVDAEGSRLKLKDFVLGPGRLVALAIRYAVDRNSFVEPAEEISEKTYTLPIDLYDRRAA
ncbi:MAG TPA: family 2 glycosyl transferase [Planctomycetaceae bacterium]|nr:family 2 glycosyl transferase [Planctomycetaceae bacterium]